MKTNKWEQAQKKETESWLETDMTNEYLLENWKKRLEDFRAITGKINSESSVLDVGSGPISVLHTFPQCKTMVALDSLNDEFAKKYQRLDYIQYITAKAEKIDFPDNSFDFIMCINALDHMDDYKSTLKEMARCLKPGGTIFLEYENTSPLSILLSKMGYKKPLNDFHPILVENKKVIKILKLEKLKVTRVICRPQLSIKKIKAIIGIIFFKKKVSDYEKNISALNYGFLRTLFHYGVISFEALLFNFFPKKFGYFTKVIAVKNK